jgi:hypothetical protein
MKDKIIKLLEGVHRLHRTRVLRKNPHMLKWVEDQYPGVELNIAVDCLIKNTSPYCCICNNPIKFLGKVTCSLSCRSQYNATSKDKIVEKRKSTMLKKYGVDNPGKLSTVKEKRLKTMVERYGAKSAPKSPEAIKQMCDNLNKKGRETLLKKYGVNNPGQLKDHAAKCKLTMLTNYGVDHFSKTENFKQAQREKLLEKWTTIFPSSIKLLSIDKNDIKVNIFENPNKEINFVCETCNSSETIPTETAKWRIKHTGTPCRNCGGINFGSLKQSQVQQFILDLGITVESNFVLNDNRQIDVFCPDFNIGFEFDGLYWHNDTRIDKKYHASKTSVAEDQGIQLIHIFEDEWDHRQEIVKSRIRNLLGKNIKKIAARNCQLQLVDSKTEKQFFELNHIQGHANSSIAIGLYYEDQLVSLMSFSKPNFAKGQLYRQDYWELLRFSSILNTSVMGAAGKLVKFFIKNYNPIQILSFADRRWSQGNLYKTLGFSNHGNTALNYWYINVREGRRIHRYKLRKNSSDNPALTEYQNRLNQGYLRIWDCGSSKWIWQK